MRYVNILKFAYEGDRMLLYPYQGNVHAKTVIRELRVTNHTHFIRPFDDFLSDP